MTSATDDLRWPRAALLALVAVATGSVAHASADGLLPAWPVMLMILAGSALVAGAFLSGPASTLRIVVLAVLGQTGVHVLLTMTAGHSDGHSAGHPATHPGGPTGSPDLTSLPTGGSDGVGTSLFDQYAAATASHGDAHAGAGGLGGILAAFGHLWEHSTGAQAPMMLLHLVAATLVGLWLAVGERALWTLIALAVSVVLPLVAALLDGVRPTPVRSVSARPRRWRLTPPTTILTRTVSRRGPPALLAA